MNSKARGRGNSTGIINPAFDGPDGQSKMPRNGRNDGEQQEKEEEESIGKRTRIFSSPITIDCRRSSDAYRDGSSFQSSRFPFSRYSNLRARSGDIASRIYHRKVEREKEKGENRDKAKRRAESISLATIACKRVCSSSKCVCFPSTLFNRSYYRCSLSYQPFALTSVRLWYLCDLIPRWLSRWFYYIRLSRAMRTLTFGLTISRLCNGKLRNGQINQRTQLRLRMNIRARGSERLCVPPSGKSVKLVIVSFSPERDDASGSVKNGSNASWSDFQQMW